MFIIIKLLCELTVNMISPFCSYFKVSVKALSRRFEKIVVISISSIKLKSTCSIKQLKEVEFFLQFVSFHLELN